MKAVPVKGDHSQVISHSRVDQDLFVVYDNQEITRPAPGSGFQVDVRDPITGVLVNQALSVNRVITDTGLVVHDYSGHGRDGLFQANSFTAYHNNSSALTGGFGVELLLGQIGFSPAAVGPNGFAMDGFVRGQQWALFVIGNDANGNVTVVLQGDNLNGNAHLSYDSTTSSQSISSPVGSWPLPNPGFLSGIPPRHVAIVVTSSLLALYINSILIGSVAITTAPPFVCTQVYWESDNFPIVLDDVAFYSTLSSGQIAAHYSATSNSASYTAAVQSDSPTAYYVLDDFGPIDLIPGTGQTVGGKFTMLGASGFFQNSTVGFIVFDQVHDISTAVKSFHPITDIDRGRVGIGSPSNFPYNHETDDWSPKFCSDGTYAWIRDQFNGNGSGPILDSVKKYSVDGGAALEILPMPPGLPYNSSFYQETWCFAPDKKNIYMASAGRTTENTFEANQYMQTVFYGEIGTTLSVWIDFTPFTYAPVISFNDQPIPTDIRAYCWIDEICVDDSTGHVFFMWDNGESGQTIFIDEYKADKTFVTRWYPRVASGPTPSREIPFGVNVFNREPYISPPFTSEPGWDSQGFTFAGPMCARGGFLYVNYDLWNFPVHSIPGVQDQGYTEEDAIWKIDTTTYNTTRSGEADPLFRADRSAAERAEGYTITPIQSLSFVSHQGSTVPVRDNGGQKVRVVDTLHIQTPTVESGPGFGHVSSASSGGQVTPFTPPPPVNPTPPPNPSPHPPKPPPPSPPPPPTPTPTPIPPGGGDQTAVQRSRGIFCGYVYSPNSPADGTSTLEEQGRWKNNIAPIGTPLIFHYVNLATEFDAENLIGNIVNQFGFAGAPICVIRVDMAGPGQTLADVAAGSNDAHYHAQADLIATLTARQGVPQILRPGWEFDGGWFTWASCSESGGQTSANNTTDYINAFRHVHSIFKGTEPSLLFDWCGTHRYGGGPAAYGSHSTSLWEASYPGAGYVDIMGLDAYNNTPTLANDDLRLAWYHEELNAFHNFAISKGLAVSFPEWGIGTPGPDYVNALLDPTMYLTAMRDFIANCPASGPGVFYHEELFDPGDPENNQGAGLYWVPTGSNHSYGLAAAAVYKSLFL